MATMTNSPAVAGDNPIPEMSDPKPAFEWPRPIVNDPIGALEKASLQIEQLRALFENNNGDLHEMIASPLRLPASLQERAETIWMVFLIVGKQLEDIDLL